MNFFGTPLYIGNNSLYDILKICVMRPQIVTHELSHFFIAKLCGFEVAFINIQKNHGRVFVLCDNCIRYQLICAFGHVGQSIIFASVVYMLNYWRNKYNSWLLTILTSCACVFSYYYNFKALFGCFDWLYYPDSNNDFTILMKNKSYITILISKIIIGCCVFYPLTTFTKIHNHKLNNKKLF